MTYELCKQLKDAGFPQDYKLGHWICKHGIEPSCKCWGEMLMYAPTLSELLEACGNKFEALINEDFEPADKCKWTVNGFDNINDRIQTIGKTPEEAVAKLWLELNKDNLNKDDNRTSIRKN